MQKIMMEFERQNEMMDMKEEMMNDTMDDVFESENETEEVTTTYIVIVPNRSLE
jgi:charged multivesicular body protein 2A